MSSITTTASRERRRPWDPISEREELPDVPLTPREGWTTLIALLVMVLAVAVAIDDAGWAGLAAGTSESQTKFLPVAAILGVLVGVGLARSRLAPLTAHLVGAVAGAMFLLWAVAGSISRSPDIIQRLHDLNISVSTFVNEVFVLGVRSSETSVFLIMMGALVWGLGQFAAFSVFRRHRAGPPIVLAGLMIMINVLLTIRSEYAHLVVFVGAVLLLVMRLNLFEQARIWRGRGMRDVTDLSNSFLRNGAVMVAVAIIAAVVLASNASSAPLGRVWTSFDDQLLEVGYTVNRWLGGVTGAARGPNVLFTRSQTIRDFWQSSGEEVFTATVSDGEARKWRGATYDSFDGRTWQQLDLQAAVLNAGDDLIAPTAEATPDEQAFDDVTVTVHPVNFGGDIFVSPGNAQTVDQPAEVLTSGPQGSFVAAKLSYGVQSGVPYTVDALVQKTSGSGAWTASELASAGRSYPEWVRRYLEIRPESVGEPVAQAARQLLNRMPLDRRDPYHIAEAVQDYLFKSGGFQYVTDVRGLCDGQKLVDCFLAVKKGYCEYFATAMVMMLRELGIPSRYVLGYLPGKEQSDGTWRVDGGASHAWVEVYFPNHGWLEFDPTPGNGENGQATTHLAAGGPVATPNPDSQGGTTAGRGETECADPLDTECLNGSDTPLPDAAPPPPGQDLSIVIALIGLLTFGLVLVLIAAYRRVPSTEPELAFNAISRLATRLGYGPRPSQTTYEYADRLGTLVPAAREDLQVIAMAKVESTYARRQPQETILRSLGVAYRRARLGLLRLVVRRPRVGRGPRQTKANTD